ncbi:MAG: nucleotide exchange factor GrpE [Sphaerobacteraceae bacterium]|nr:MAG: nucleotide exchange factor GrpE [Sphaerobacteraceae bacterium]
MHRGVRGRLRSLLKSLTPQEESAEDPDVQELALEVELLARSLVTEPDSLPPPANETVESLRNTRLVLNNMRVTAQTTPESEQRREASSAADDELPGNLAKELIALRDSLMLNMLDETGEANEIARNVYDHLGKILVRDGVVPIEDTGAFDRERHRVIETISTDDPAHEQTIHRTLRSGYLVNGRIFRPQEVVVNSLDGARG